ncbi:hypothetical protein [Planomicrobium sp. Y74]|uniref:hypothetical protein n=1 Tax=Planomicrobium sp. Y74 TaxID=2478977 RepID=UPI0011C3EC65|nr:hypothetical protein [Planomicrobium sp. Y74]
MYPTYNFKVAWCLVCSQGWVEIVREKETNNLLFLCEECETQWKAITDVWNNKNGIHDDTSFVTAPSLQEIERMGWSDFI